MKLDSTKIAIALPLLRKLIVALWNAFRDKKSQSLTREQEVQDEAERVIRSAGRIISGLKPLFEEWHAGVRTFSEVLLPLRANIEIIIDDVGKEWPHLDEPGHRELVIATVIAYYLHEWTGDDDLALLPGDDTRAIYHMIMGLTALWRAKRAATS